MNTWNPHLAEHSVITASMIGISTERWTSVSRQTPLEKVKHLMSKERFDVLPCETKEKKVKGFFQTIKPGDYSQIEFCELTPEHCIYYLTTLEDLVKAFVLDINKRFFFLTNHSQVLGMVSPIQLRSRDVLLYLFSQLVNLERSLAEFLCQVYSDEELTSILQVEGESERDKHALISLENYQRERKQGKDNALLEYLYLSTLLNLLNCQGWYKSLGYKNPKVFQKKVFHFLTGIRNQVMHPLKKEISPKKILTFLNLNQEIQNRISEISLYVAYFQTDYMIDIPEISLTIGQTNTDLDNLLKSASAQNWMFITAWNPESQRYSLQDNQLRNQALEYALNKRGYRYFSGRGEPHKAGWISEESFLVLGTDRQTAVDWGRRFGQNAVVWGALNQSAELISCHSGEVIALPVPVKNPKEIG